MRGRTLLAVLAVVAVIAVVATGMSLLVTGSDDSDDSGGRGAFRAFPPCDVVRLGVRVAAGAELVDPGSGTSSPEVEGSTGPIRVDPDLAPPTNRWYSGMFLGAAPQPVFAMPLAVLAEDTGVSVGLPRVSATERTITAPFAPEVRLGLECGCLHRHAR